MIFPKAITLLIFFVMLCLMADSKKLAMFYIIFRPVVQPFATEHYMLYKGIPLSAVFAITLIMGSMMICILKRGYSLLVPGSIYFYLIIFFSSLSFLHTMDHVVSISYLLKIMTAVALSTLIYSSIRSEDDAKDIIWAIALAAIIPMLVGYYQFIAVVGHETYYGFTRRATGGLGFANMYGIFLALSFYATLMLLLQEKRRKVKYFLTAILFSIIISSFIALNRGSWIGLSVAAFFAYPFYRKGST